MAKRIITISREFGSGGRFIGEEVAKKYHQSDCRRVRSVTRLYSGKCRAVPEKGDFGICTCRT